MHPKNYLTKGFIDWIGDYHKADSKRFLKRKNKRMVRREGKRQETDA
jgi:hypothetical protein